MAELRSHSSPTTASYCQQLDIIAAESAQWQQLASHTAATEKEAAGKQQVLEELTRKLQLQHEEACAREEAATLQGQRQIEGLSQQLCETANQLQGAAAERDSLAKQVGELSGQLAAADSLAASLTQKVVSMELHAAMLQGHLATTRAELDDVQCQVAEVGVLRAEVGQLRSENERLQKAVQEHSNDMVRTPSSSINNDLPLSVSSGAEESMQVRMVVFKKSWRHCTSNALQLLCVLENMSSPLVVLCLHCS